MGIRRRCVEVVTRPLARLLISRGGPAVLVTGTLAVAACGAAIGQPGPTLSRVPTWPRTYCQPYLDGAGQPACQVSHPQPATSPAAGCYADPDGDGSFACWGRHRWVSGWVFGLHDLSTQPPASPPAFD